MKLTHMNSAWINQCNTIADRAQLIPVDANKVYANGGKWYDDVTNVTVANSATSIHSLSDSGPK